MNKNLPKHNGLHSVSRQAITMLVASQRLLANWLSPFSVKCSRCSQLYERGEWRR